LGDDWQGDNGKTRMELPLKIFVPHRAKSLLIFRLPK
jgi:hypothetical protein